MDSLATSRSDDMNEATRRLLGVLLRFIDGFKSTDSIVVAATNRKQDLDAALLSRCQAIVTFGLPDVACRADILKHYAAHLAAEVRLLLVLQQFYACGVMDIAPSSTSECRNPAVQWQSCQHHAMQHV